MFLHVKLKDPRGMCHHLKNYNKTNFIFIQKGKCLFSLGHRYPRLPAAVLLPNGLRTCTVCIVGQLDFCVQDAEEGL